MACVKFTRHLVRYFPALSDNVEVNGRNVAQILTNLNKQYPGLTAYIIDEQGTLRKHVNIFIAGDLIHDRKTLQDPVNEDDQVYIFQALSGG
jgi:molybdopterin synthase sulfur carrier subunit